MIHAVVAIALAGVVLLSALTAFGIAQVRSDCRAAERRRQGAPTVEVQEDRL